MTIDEVKSLMAFDEWANDRIFQSLSALSEEQTSRQIVSSFSSIRDTLAHIVAVEWVWLRRWLGESPTSSPDWMTTAPVTGLHTHLREVETARAAFIATLNNADLDRPVRYKNLKGEAYVYPLRDLFFHLVSHSTYHRGQLVTMIRQVGAMPPALDYVLFKDSRVE